MLLRLLTSPFAAAGLLTGGFLLLCGEGGPLAHPLVARYALGHPLAVATVGLFFAGLAAVAGRAYEHRREAAAVAALGEATFAAPGAALAWAGDSPTAAGVRVRGLLAEPPAAGAGEDRLRTLHDAAADRLHDAYGLVRTVTWAVPILGFLGTVVGITLAIANIDPAGLGESLGEVTGGLAVAFDTTALALTLSLVLVFLTHATEGAELANLERLRDAAFGTLLPLLPAAEADPLRAAAGDVAEEMRRRAGDLADVHAAAWRGSLEQMRTAWAETLADERAALAADLAAGQREATGEFLDAVRAASGEIGGAVAGWNETLDAARAADADRAATLRSLADSLGAVAEHAAARAAAAERVDANLHALHESGRFGEAVHALTAAVHLLTARAERGPRGSGGGPVSGPRTTRRLTAAANRRECPCVAPAARPSACSRSSRCCCAPAGR